MESSDISHYRIVEKLGGCGSDQWPVNPEAIPRFDCPPPPIHWPLVSGLPPAHRHLYFSFTNRSFESSCWHQERRTFHAETHIPAESSSPLEDARLSHPYEDQERTRGHLPAPGQGPQASFRKARISWINQAPGFRPQASRKAGILKKALRRNAWCSKPEA